MLTPKIPPNIPHTIPATIIIIDCSVKEKFWFIILDNKYILIKYIPPIKAPFAKPFLFILKLPIVLPINMLIAVITIMILGIKYMMGSVQERAEYKKSMIPYLVGCILLFATITIVNAVYHLLKPLQQ